MLSLATKGEVTGVADVAERGAIILGTSIWNCDLDYPEEGTVLTSHWVIWIFIILFSLNLCFCAECNPDFRFQRIDGREGSISSGFNFRTIHYDTDEQTRYLAKLMGIRFVFVTEGTAGKFNFAALTVTLGGKKHAKNVLFPPVKVYGSVIFVYF